MHCSMYMEKLGSSCCARLLVLMHVGADASNAPTCLSIRSVSRNSERRSTPRERLSPLLGVKTVSLGCFMHQIVHDRERHEVTSRNTSSCNGCHWFVAIYTASRVSSKSHIATRIIAGTYRTAFNRCKPSTHPHIQTTSSPDSLHFPSAG
jgi:hypothetical protein